MIIIAIHGFKVSLFPSIWDNSSKLKKIIKQSKKYNNVKLVKIGYKNVLYSGRFGILWLKKGFPQTIKQIVKYHKKYGGPVIILGKSLGGFAASILTQYLIEEGIEIEILNQLDAIPIFKESPLYSEKWLQSINESEEHNKSEAVLCDDLNKDLEDRIFYIPNHLLSLAQNLLDPITDSKLDKRFIQSINKLPHLHQQIFEKDDVKYHYYYYSAKGAWNVFNELVHLASKFETEAIKTPAPNLENFPISRDHMTIDRDARIFNLILNRLEIELRFWG